VGAGVTTFKFGRIYWTKVRNFLNHCRFLGLQFEWAEGSGFASRSFWIKGPDAPRVIASLKDWIDERDSDE
jgi:hypothetical protein